jgi:esterase
VKVKLHSGLRGKGAPVLLLHGLFGSGNNLGALARSLQDRYAVHSLDLPNHGRSGWVDCADLSVMAEAISDWMHHHGVATASFVGHSLGGKVAMQLALRYPRRVSALALADIAPVEYPSHHDQVFMALEAVDAAACQSREEGASLMAAHLEEQDVIQFLLTSLQREADGTYRWRFNLRGLKDNYGAVRSAPAAASAYRGPVLFIKGGESNYITAAHRGRILSLFPKAEVRIMPGCGHWLHAQHPVLFNGIVGRFLDAQSP